MSSFDLVRELIVLGLDTVILTLCVREYCGHKRTISALKVYEIMEHTTSYITKLTMILNIKRLQTNIKSTVTWWNMSEPRRTKKSVMPLFGEQWNPLDQQSKVWWLHLWLEFCKWLNWGRESERIVRQDLIWTFDFQWTSSGQRLCRNVGGTAEAHSCFDKRCSLYTVERKFC